MKRSIKLYCDASFNENTKEAKVGIIIKFLKREIYRDSCVISNVLDSTEAEFYAIQNGIITLKENNLNFARIYSDNKPNIKVMDGRGKCNSKYKQLVKYINEISEGMDLKFEWIPRNKNQIADQLTR